MVDERAAYPGSPDFSEQLSYRKHFHLIYGLISMNFQRLKQYSKTIINPKIDIKTLDARSTVYTKCTQ